MFVVLGALQIVVAGGAFLFGPQDGHEPKLPAWLDHVMGFVEAILPGLCLLAIGEGLRYLAAISNARKRES